MTVVALMILNVSSKFEYFTWLMITAMLIKQLNIASNIKFLNTQNPKYLYQKVSFDFHSAYLLKHALQLHTCFIVEDNFGFICNGIFLRLPHSQY